MRRLRPISQASSPGRRLAVVLAAVAFVLPASPEVKAADPRLERAQQQREERQDSLNELLERIQTLQAEEDDLAADLERLQGVEQRQRTQADAAVEQVARRARQSYTYGTVDPLLSLLGAEDPLEVTEQVRMLGYIAERNQAVYEEASAASRRTEAVVAQTRRLREQLAQRQAELDETRDRAAELLAEAKQEVEAVKETIRREEEEARRRAERRRAAAQRGSRSTGGIAGAAAAPVSGGMSCPVGNPRSFSDTWGAARSGGRSHQGTDILAPYGTPVHAIEDGTIARLNSNRLGGISLYLQGDSGNLYYYTHLAGYAGGIGVGQRVRAGQHIAVNGDSGNAAGIPHVHLEVRPGGGGSVNPYPYVRRACG